MLQKVSSATPRGPLGLILQAMENGSNILSKGFWLLPMVKAVIIKNKVHLLSTEKYFQD